jgi:hypothetical protein
MEELPPPKQITSGRIDNEFHRFLHIILPSNADLDVVTFGEYSLYTWLYTGRPHRVFSVHHGRLLTEIKLPAVYVSLKRTETNTV